MSANDFLNKLINKEDLSKAEAKELAEILFDLQTKPTMSAAILTALTMKGESVEEILGFVEVLRKNMIRVKYDGNLIDTCGTGGDGKNTFNISTAVALVTAACGVKVAKHGNRSATGVSGSADVLEAIGVNINANKLQIKKSLDEANITFLFAPNFHPLMKIVGPVRKELKIRTIFNLIGPLLNPMSVKRQIIGVSGKEIQDKLAQVILKLSYEHAMVIHSDDGMDEVSIYGKTQVAEINDGKIKKFEIDPQAFGLKGEDNKEVRAIDVLGSKNKLLAVFEGRKGDMRKIVLLNAGCSLYISGKYKSIAQGINEAEKAIDSGEALLTLNKFIRTSNGKYD